jgi:protease I
MEKKNRTVLMIIAPEKFRDEELNHPREVFKSQGADVTVVSTKAGTATGSYGHKEKIGKTVDDVAGDTFDAVVVVGGGGSPQYLWDNKKIHDIVRRHLQLGKVVSAICLSGAVLAKAGILDGVEATVWKSDESMKAYAEHKVKYVDKPVVRSGKIITANGPAAARDFGTAIMSAL